MSAGVRCNDKSREDGKVRMRLGLWSQSGSDRKRVAHALREECAAQRPKRCNKDLEYGVARVAKTAGGVWRGGRSSRDHGEQAAGPSQRCGGMRGWAALSSHRTSDMPASGCAIGEAMHVGCGVDWQWIVAVLVVVAVVVQ